MTTYYICPTTIIRDYHIGTLVIARHINRDPFIKPESVSSRADNGRGLILRAKTKVPCYNLFITYSKTFFFRLILIKNTKNIDFHSEIEELRHKIRVMSFRPTGGIELNYTSLIICIKAFQNIAAWLMSAMSGRSSADNQFSRLLFCIGWAGKKVIGRYRPIVGR